MTVGDLVHLDVQELGTEGHVVVLEQEVEVLGAIPQQPAGSEVERCRGSVVGQPGLEAGGRRGRHRPLDWVVVDADRVEAEGLRGTWR